METDILNNLGEKVLVLSAIPYSELYNNRSNEDTTDIQTKEIGNGFIYILSQEFSDEGFITLITPRPIFLCNNTNQFDCHSPKYVQRKIILLEDKRGDIKQTVDISLEGFELYDLENYPFLEHPLQTEPSGFFPLIRTRIKFKDTEIEFKQGTSPNDLLLIDYKSKKTKKVLTNYAPYLFGVFRSENYLFMICNDYSDWDSTIARIRLASNACFDDLPVKNNQLEIEAFKTLPHQIVSGAVVNKKPLEKIIQMYDSKRKSPISLVNLE